MSVKCLVLAPFKYSLSYCLSILLKLNTIVFLCSIEAQKSTRNWYLSASTIFIWNNPRTASATRALLRLSPCYWAHLNPIWNETSGAPSSLDLTGGEYKTWERIHRSIADLRLLAIPTSWGRVADLNPNWADFYKDLLHLTALRLVVIGIVSRVRPKASRDMLTWRHPRLPPPP